MIKLVHGYEPPTINQSGQILVFVMMATAVILISILLTIGGSQLYFQNSNYKLQAEKATSLAEAGADKAVASLNRTGGSYSGESETFFGNGSYSVKITSKDAATKIIESTGYVPNKQKPISTKTVRVEVSKGVGISFVYGIQVGEGGLELGHGNTVEGSIYSNGNIVGDQNNTVTGDVWVAGGPQSNADQQTDCSEVNCQDYIFGKNVSGENRLDVGMSFRPQSSASLNKISIKIKKFDNPSDATVRIMGDDNGKPDKNNVLTSGLLYSSLVTSSYGWIDVTFSSTPALSADNTYWIVIDTSSDSTKYWSWQNDLAQSYTRGQPSWSANWNTGNPGWNSISGDLSFKIFMGGVATSLRATNINFVVNGDVHANTIDRINIGGDAFYQTILNSTVAGTSNPGSSDPPPSVFPISEANISSWKQEAQTAGLLSAPACNSSAPWGPGKYEGSIIFNNNCTVKVKSPVWITGSVILNNDNIFQLDSTYGTASGLMIVDGLVEMENNNKFIGTGQGSSLLMVLSTYDSRNDGITAIDVKNNGNTGVFYANNGIIQPGNNNEFKELTAWKIKLVNNSTINYETGLSSTLFSSGPSGSYTLIKGTYTIK